MQYQMKTKILAKLADNWIDYKKSSNEWMFGQGKSNQIEAIFKSMVKRKLHKLSIFNF